MPRAATSISGNPWDLEEFNELPGGRDRWEQVGFDAEGYEWWVRRHPKLRNRSFQPVHGSTPWSLERSTGERVTVIYHCPGFRWERTVRIDDWRDERSASFSGVREWKGFTLFKLWPSMEHQRTSSSASRDHRRAEHREEDLSTRSYHTSDVAGETSRSRSSYSGGSRSAGRGYGGADPSSSRARERARAAMRSEAPLPRDSDVARAATSRVGDDSLPRGLEGASGSAQLPLAREDAPPSEFLEVTIDQESTGSFELVDGDEESW